MSYLAGLIFWIRLIDRNDCRVKGPHRPILAEPRGSGRKEYAIPGNEKISIFHNLFSSSSSFVFFSLVC
jgi:hypothetical protein